jgi:hypothetical protein
MTTTASTLKLKSEISRITQILQANGVEFEEARRSARTQGLPFAARPISARVLTRRRCAAQVDLSLEPGRRDEMFEASKTRVLPQLHCDGKVRSAVRVRCAALPRFLR